MLHWPVYRYKLTVYCYWSVEMEKKMFGFAKCVFRCLIIFLLAILCWYSLFSSSTAPGCGLPARQSGIYRLGPRWHHREHAERPPLRRLQRQQNHRRERSTKHLQKEIDEESRYGCLAIIFSLLVLHVFRRWLHWPGRDRVQDRAGPGLRDRRWRRI